MATNAIGPTFAGGMQPIIEEGLELLYYPDVNNNALQAEGKSPVFYWLPNYVHIARKDGKPDGDLLFSLIRFAGREAADGSTDLGEGKTTSVAGGVLGFSVTSAPSDAVLKASQKKIIDMFRGKNDFFWGIRENAEPIFRFVPIVSNETMVSNLSPQASGAAPIAASELNANSESKPLNGEPPRAIEPAIRSLFKFSKGDDVPEHIRAQKPVGMTGYASIRSIANSDRFIENMSKVAIPVRDLPKLNNAERGAVDPWFWTMQGQGKGTIDPMGVDAYTAMVGAYPTAIMWQAFHGSYTPVFVDYLMKVKFWTPQIEITIKGNWDRVYNHFSANANGRYMWFSADIKAEINDMRINGAIEVDIKVDSTIPNGEQIVEKIEKRSDLIFEKFMEEAKKVIFDPPMVNEEAAKTQNKPTAIFAPYSAGLALKYRRDSTKLELYYHETRQIAYLQEVPISGSLEGVYDEIQKNPEAEKKYFHTVDLNDWPQKLSRITKPVADFDAMPIAFLSVQHGYPNTKGELNWVGRTFSKSDPADTTGIFEFVQKQKDQVDNPPANWNPDQTYLKRTVHMREDSNPFANLFDKVVIRDNKIELDPQPNGSLTNDTTIEVRADDAGRLRVGPIGLGVELENSKQLVEVVFQLTDENFNVLGDYEPVKFIWKYDDQQTSRYWSIYTQDTAVRPYFRYQVKVIVKGTLTTKGMEWAGPWMNSLGNGPLTISVPTPEDRGIQIIRNYKTRELQASRELAKRAIESPVIPPSAAEVIPGRTVVAAEPPVATEETTAIEYLIKKSDELIHN